MDFTLSAHARDVLQERKIREEWLHSTLIDADWTEKGIDGNVHYYKRIAEHANRVLHVVVNPTSPTVVTVFFDRRARSKK